VGKAKAAVVSSYFRQIKNTLYSVGLISSTQM